jgi:hypothetical protein
MPDGGAPIGLPQAGGGGAPIGPQQVGGGGGPIGGGGPTAAPGAQRPAALAITAAGAAQIPVGTAISPFFNIGGAPIAILGGVFSGGLPIGGPVTQIFRGVGPLPNTLFIATISPGGPIGSFLIGSQGGPIGVDVFGGGGLPIELGPAAAITVESIQPRTAEVATSLASIGGPVLPALAFGGAAAAGPATPIGHAPTGSA